MEFSVFAITGTKNIYSIRKGSYYYCGNNKWSIFRWNRLKIYEDTGSHELLHKYLDEITFYKHKGVTFTYEGRYYPEDEGIIRF